MATMVIASAFNQKQHSLPSIVHSPLKTLTFQKTLTFNKNTLNNNKRTSSLKSRISATATVTTAIPSPETEPNKIPYKLFLSDFVVTRPKNVFTKRKWEYLDYRALIVTVILHGLSLFAPFTFSWSALGVAALLHWVTGVLGICLSYHRQLTHKSFKLPKWLEYTFAYCGVLGSQGNPIEWVSRHRFHHMYADTEKDMHSPLEGFWFSHWNWLFDNGTVLKKTGEANNVEDLESQAFYRFIRDTYWLHTLALAGVLYALGGFPYIVWGMGVRTACTFHTTFLLSSVAHIWGDRPWNTPDFSRNNWWVAVLSAGEGWHNNHHAFEYSARHGFEWWQYDLTWYIIYLLRAVGLATDVKLPLESHKQRFAYNTQEVKS